MRIEAGVISGLLLFYSLAIPQEIRKIVLLLDLSPLLSD
nr:MAG TPA: hypothetical protein [Caudoviricetes sp.]